jgi:DNA primase large subunit
VKFEENRLNVYNIGITKQKSINEVNAKYELLSYPIARIMVSCINDKYLIHKYAHAEAESAYNVIRKINLFLNEYDDINFILKELADDFDIKILIDDESIAIHFTDYIRYATIFHDSKWKLINSNMKCGMIYLTKEDFARIIQEAIRKKIESSLPLVVPSEICASLESYNEEIRNNLVAQKSEFNIEEFKEIMPDCFPPCMVHALSNAQAGINLAHSMRFALVSFLLNIGMNVDGIIELFKVSPDFDEERTRYQVNHIHGATGTAYTSPSCATMTTYGNCFGKEALCDRISHPLSYYRKKAWILKKGKPEDTKKHQNS